MDALVLAENKKQVMQAMSLFSTMLSEVTEEQTPQAFEMVEQIEDVMGEVRDRLRKKMLEKVQAEGQRISDKGSMQVGLGGYSIKAIPTKTGVDGRKLEALLRKRNVDPALYMDVTMEFKVNQTKLQTALSNGVLTPDDLKNCEHTPSFRLQVERDG